MRRIIILVAAALALIAGTLALAMAVGLHYQSQEEQQDEKQVSIEKNKVEIEKNKVRIGMTINQVLSVVHGMQHINAYGDGAEFFVPSHGIHFYHDPERITLARHDDGTFTFQCYCGKEPVSRILTESQANELVTAQNPEQLLPNLTESQAGELMKQKMSSKIYGEWRWKYTFNGFPSPFFYSFEVAFGRDGRVKGISDIQVYNLRNHRA